MKVLVATEKPFAAAAVEGIKKEIEGAVKPPFRAFIREDISLNGL